VKAAVTGASGLVGGNLAEILLGAGHAVRGTRRGSTRIEHLSDLAIEWADAALDDRDGLARAFTGCDVVFHCAAMIDVRKDVTPELEATNVGGTENVIAAVRAARVPRLVHVSSNVAIGLSDDGAPIDETAPWNFEAHGLADGYAITKRAAEDRVHAAVADGLDAVIVNPTWMCGPRDARPTAKLLLDLATRKVPGWTSGYNNFVDVRDVCRGMIAAWQRGRRGERYILGGADMTYRDMMRLVAKVAGVAPPRMYMPRLAARVVGWMGDRSEKKGKKPLANSTQVRYAYSDRFRFTSAKAERELGYTVGPFEDAVKDALAWFRARGMLASAA
jgi:dihydroflavonol-4-reductase